MTRGPRPHRALAEAVSIAKARGIFQMALSGPERVFDIAIISKVPVSFVRVMFAPAILATTRQLANDFRQEIAKLRIIARDAAITAELWLRSKHGTWRFFLVMPNSLVEIDREGKRLESGQTVAYVTGTSVSEGEYPPPENPYISPSAPGPVSGPVVPLFPHPPEMVRS